MEELFNTESRELQKISIVDKSIHKKCYDCIHFEYEHNPGHAGDCIRCTHPSQKYKVASAGFQFVLCKGYHYKSSNG